MTRIDAALKHAPTRLAGMMNSAGLLPMVAALALLPGCSKSDDAPGVLTGQRMGEKGAPCASFMDCKAELECVNGRCGVFGESTQAHTPGAQCEEKGEPGNTLPSGGGLSSSAAVTTTGAIAPSTTGTKTTTATTSKTTTTATTSKTTTTTGGGGGSTDEKTGGDPIPELCKSLPAEFQKAKNPYPTTNTAIVAEGKALYKKPPNRGQSCGGRQCHGSSGMGNARDQWSNFTSAESKARPDCQMLHATLKGVQIDGQEAMPAYHDKLTQDEAWKIITYIRTLEVPTL